MVCNPADLDCVLACLCECTLRAQTFRDSPDIRWPQRNSYACNDCAKTFSTYPIKKVFEIIFCACLNLLLPNLRRDRFASKKSLLRNLPTVFCGREGICMHAMTAQKHLAQIPSKKLSKLFIACAGTVSGLAIVIFPV